MLVIIGFGRKRKKDFGEIAQVRCPHCHNNVAYHLTRTRTWFTLYFIPILPYRNDRRLECPICSHGMRVFRNEVESLRQGDVSILKYLEQPAESSVSRRTN
jgi:C4-type Zn-finger protein